MSDAANMVKRIHRVQERFAKVRRREGEVSPLLILLTTDFPYMKEVMADVADHSFLPTSHP